MKSSKLVLILFSFFVAHANAQNSTAQKYVHGGMECELQIGPIRIKSTEKLREYLVTKYNFLKLLKNIFENSDLGDTRNVKVKNSYAIFKDFSSEILRVENWTPLLIVADKLNGKNNLLKNESNKFELRMTLQLISTDAKNIKSFQESAIHLILEPVEIDELELRQSGDKCDLLSKQFFRGKITKANWYSVTLGGNEWIFGSEIFENKRWKTSKILGTHLLISLLEKTNIKGREFLSNGNKINKDLFKDSNLNAENSECTNCHFNRYEILQQAVGPTRKIHSGKRFLLEHQLFNRTHSIQESQK